jgi:hypothetical protein
MPRQIGVSARRVITFLMGNVFQHPTKVYLAFVYLLSYRAIIG